MYRFVMMNVENRFKHFIYNVFIQLGFFDHFKNKLMAYALNAIFEVLNWLAICIKT